MLERERERILIFRTVEEEEKRYMLKPQSFLRN
jgi:hypothetical protein